MEMKTKDMVAIAFMCIGSWCAYHAYVLYHSFPANAARVVARVVHSGITKTDVSVLSYAIGGAALIIAAFAMFGDRKKK